MRASERELPALEARLDRRQAYRGSRNSWPTASAKRRSSLRRYASLLIGHTASVRKRILDRQLTPAHHQDVPALLKRFDNEFCKFGSVSD